MKLKAPYISPDAVKTLKEVSEKLDGLQRYAIDQVPWPLYPYLPDAKFSIAYTNDAILLKYFVEENSIRICCHTTNGAVHEDSCVEFFIMFDGEAEYYNLEFNCIGICSAAFGKSRDERELLSAQSISRIKRLSQIKGCVEEDKQQVSWQLTLVIPMDTFIHHGISDLKNKNCKVNFYKCGDALPNPHFLSWKQIVADSPDFHLPQFFGEMQFV